MNVGETHIKVKHQALQVIRIWTDIFDCFYSEWLSLECSMSQYFHQTYQIIIRMNTKCIALLVISRKSNLRRFSQNNITIGLEYLKTKFIRLTNWIPDFAVFDSYLCDVHLFPPHYFQNYMIFLKLGISPFIKKNITGWTCICIQYLYWSYCRYWFRFNWIESNLTSEYRKQTMLYQSSPRSLLSDQVPD